MCNAWGPGSAAEQELTRLMDTYGSMLHNLCTMMLHDHHRAQDAVQDTFIKAYKSLDKLPQVQNEKAWLIRIAMNTCRDVLRSAWLRHTLRSADISQLPELPSPEPEDSGILEEVRALPPKYRQVILLYYWQNMSADEIGQVLNMNRATVYRQLGKARQKLKLTMEGWAET